MTGTRSIDLPSASTIAVTDTIVANVSNVTSKVPVQAIVDRVQVQAAGSFLDLSDTPDTYANFTGVITGSKAGPGANLQVATDGTGVTFRWSTSDYIDIRDYDETLTSTSDITAAMAAAIADFGVNHEQNVIRIPRMGLKTDFLTWDPTGQNLFAKIIETQASIKLSTTLSVPAGCIIRGIGTQFDATILSVPIPPVEFKPITSLSGTLDPVVEMTGTAGESHARIENIRISGGKKALYVHDVANWSISRCHFDSTAAAYPLEIENCFWGNIDQIQVQPRAAGDYQGIKIHTTVGSGSDTGLINMTDIRLERAGILFGPANGGPVGVNGIIIKELISENQVASTDLLTIDSSGTGHVKAIEVYNCSIADAGGDNYLLNVSGGTGDVDTVIIRTSDFNHAMRPTSQMPRNITWDFTTCNATNAQDLVKDIFAGKEWPQNYDIKWPGAIDARLLTAPTNACPYVPYTPLPVIQDPASWVPISGDTITTGQLGPDGSTMAGLIQGTGGARVYNQSHSLSVGDWIIAGAWCTDPPVTAGFKVHITNADYNGATTENAPILYQVEKYMGQQGWQFIVGAYKVTSVTSNPNTLQFDLSSGGSDGYWFAPCMMLIPTGTTNITDAGMLRYARSLKSSWSSNAVAGDISLLDHQNLLVKGKYVALQGLQTIWVPASAMTPRVTNGAAVAPREVNSITLGVLAFDQTTSEGANFSVTFPKSWNAGTITFRPHWTAASGTGTVKFDLKGGSFADNVAINSTGLGTAIGVTDTLQNTNSVHNSGTSSAVTISNAAVDVPTYFEISRDVATDTLSADAELIGIEIFYTTSSGNDA